MSDAVLGRRSQFQSKAANQRCHADLLVRLSLCGENKRTILRGVIMPDIDDFLRNQAKKLRENDGAPKTRVEWEKRKESLRDKMFAAMGEFPAQPCGLEPRELGTLKRDGYHIEKIIFQTRTNVRATACAYVPDVKGRVPAVLVVHGH